MNSVTVFFLFPNSVYWTLSSQNLQFLFVALSHLGCTTVCKCDADDRAERLLLLEQITDEWCSWEQVYCPQYTVVVFFNFMALGREPQTVQEQLEGKGRWTKFFIFFFVCFFLHLNVTDADTTVISCQHQILGQALVWWRYLNDYDRPLIFMASCCFLMCGIDGIDL